MIKDRKSLAWILAATIAPLLLFIQKPFHIDDSAFLEVAQNILQHPLDPFHGSVALVDHDYRVFQRFGIEPNTFDSMSHPPLVPYVMAAVIKMSGGVSEIPLHVAFILFPVLAGLSAFSLAERFSNIPRVAALLLIISPIFMVNAQNLMTDVPMLALMLASVALFINGVDRNKIWFVILAGCIAGLTALTRYVGFITIPIFFFYAILNKKGMRPAMIATAAAFTIFAVWLVQNVFVYGTAHITASYTFYRRFYADQNFAQRVSPVIAVCDFAALGGCSFLFAGLLVYMKKPIKITLIPSLVVGLILLIILKNQSDPVSEYTFMQLAFLYLFTCAGIFLITEAIRVFIQKFRDKDSSSARTEDIVFLFLWFFLALISALFLLPFGTGRYMLPVLFPLILILTVGIDKSSKKIYPGLITFSIFLTFLAGLILSWADCEYALTYKLFAKNIRETNPTDRLWFMGEWGFRYYMKEQGAKYLLSDNTSPAFGDMIIKPEIAGLHRMSESVSQRCVNSDPIEVDTPNPVRVMNYTAKAGFYSHGFGLLPFSISNAPLERFEICRIMK